MPLPAPLQQGQQERLLLRKQNRRPRSPWRTCAVATKWRKVAATGTDDVRKRHATHLCKYTIIRNDIDVRSDTN